VGVNIKGVNKKNYIPVKKDLDKSRVHPALVLRPIYVTEKVGVNIKGVNKKMAFP